MSNADIGAAILEAAGVTVCLHEWRPIETVPKDGTSVLVWLPTKMHQSHVHAARWAPCINGTMGIIGGVFDFDASCKPSHWMPQPGAPDNGGEQHG